MPYPPRITGLEIDRHQTQPLRHTESEFDQARTFPCLRPRLIDLEDRRSIAVLQTLLNDPDEVIVQAAKDAILILGSPLTPPLTNP